ncbi:DNA methyltransferase [Bradyrhizobium sp. WSM1253]|uniref:DNA methyltransferase n=1 Tax=Bradyrhizobium sp. WSM1253 TaxID=319003 RepID=UPI0035296F42
MDGSIATNPSDLVVDLFGGSGTTAAVAHKMRRRWLITERNFQTVRDFLLPRLQHVVSGTDPGGITEMLSWAGGGGFEVAQVSPRFGTGYSSAGFGGIRRSLKKTAIREDILAA